jgi:hypothetical protein
VKSLTIALVAVAVSALAPAAQADRSQNDWKYRNPGRRPAVGAFRRPSVRHTTEVRAPSEIYAAMTAAIGTLVATAKQEVCANRPGAVEVLRGVAYFEQSLGMKQFVGDVTEAQKEAHDLAKYAVMDLHEVAETVDSVMKRYPQNTQTVKGWNENLLVLLEELEKSILVVTQPLDAARMGIVLRLPQRSALFKTIYKGYR